MKSSKLDDELLDATFSLDIPYEIKVRGGETGQFIKHIRDKLTLGSATNRGSKQRNARVR
jgi:hypothetical protein